MISFQFTVCRVAAYLVSGFLGIYAKPSLHLFFLILSQQGRFLPSRLKRTFSLQLLGLLRFKNYWCKIKCFLEQILGRWNGAIIESHLSENCRITRFIEPWAPKGFKDDQSRDSKISQFLVEVFTSPESEMRKTRRELLPKTALILYKGLFFI